MMPQAPLTPCTEIAPHGSSTWATWSKNHTPAQTRTPAMAPMIEAAHGATKAQGAVIATKPANIPLQLMETPGLPYLYAVHPMANTNPKQADRMVVTTKTEIRRPVAPNVD